MCVAWTSTPSWWFDYLHVRTGTRHVLARLWSIHVHSAMATGSVGLWIWYSALHASGLRSETVFARVKDKRAEGGPPVMRSYIRNHEGLTITTSRVDLPLYC